MFAFFTGNEVEKYLFYKVPQMLFSDEKFIKLSCEAKLLYGILLDRCGLSKKNKWVDNDGKIFIFFKQDEACEMLGIGKGKAVKVFNELEQIGLICRKKQGQGKPTKIYVCNFTQFIDDNQILACDTDIETLTSAKSKSETSDYQENSQTEVKTSENRKSETSDYRENSQTEVLTSKNRKSALPKIESLYIYSMNQTKMNQTNQSIYQNSDIEQKSEKDRWIDGEQAEYEAYLKDSIDYKSLISQGYNPDTLDLIIDILLEPYNPSTEAVKVNGRSVSPQNAIRQYEKIDSTHIEYVLDCLADVAKRKQIKNIRAYLTTSLYNAPHTIDLHYDSEVAYDFANDII